MQTWRTLSKTTILDHGKYLSVEDHHIQLPDGRMIPDWPYLITPDFINVLALTIEHQALIFQQTKYATGETLAIVGGYLEPDEDPLAAAQRELREETGYTAPNWIALGQYTIDANRGCGVGHLYLAQAASRTHTPTADDLEEQHLLTLSLSELETALYANQFKAIAWTTTIALALKYLKAE